MKSITFSALAAILALASAAASFAQVPSGGPYAKGNAPLKHGHTVNDGVAKPGRTSFTMKQAQSHIEHAGYTGVTGLTKGADGVWRGQATKDGTARDIGLDFKGNVSEGGAGADSASPKSAAMSTTKSTSSATVASQSAPPNPGAMQGQATGGAAVSATAGASTGHHRRHRHHRHHHMTKAACAAPSPNGAACSGVDRNENGISDREDRAIKGGAKP